MLLLIYWPTGVPPLLYRLDFETELSGLRMGWPFFTMFSLLSNPSLLSTSFSSYWTRFIRSIDFWRSREPDSAREYFWLKFSTSGISYWFWSAIMANLPMRLGD
jgi:hypothetical protein